MRIRLQRLRENELNSCALIMGRKENTRHSALRVLRASGVEFEQHSYVERGGAQHAARCLGIDLHSAIKTLVFEDENKQPLLVLMHGDYDGRWPLGAGYRN